MASVTPNALTESATDLSSPSQLRHLQNKLLRLVRSAETISDLFGGLADAAREYAAPTAILHAQGSAEHELLVPNWLLSEECEDEGEDRQLASCCLAACRLGDVEVRHQLNPPRLLVGVPVAAPDEAAEALGFAFPRHESAPAAVLFAQLLANHLILWREQMRGQEQQASARDTAAVVGLLEILSNAEDLQHAVHALTCELQGYIGCHRVAIGLRTTANDRCRMAAISGVSQFDRRSPTVRAMEAAFDEVLLRDDITNWPSEKGEHYAALAHKHLCSSDEMRTALSTPLHGTDGEAIGALLLLDGSRESWTDVIPFVRSADKPLAASLAVIQNAESSYTTRVLRAMSQSGRSWKARVALVGALLLSIVLSIPLSYRIRCDCQIEPVTRRYVAAPFEGTLARTLVHPGDVVQVGDLLAQMDGREIRWKRAGVVADRHQARKKRDAAQAAHNYAEAQIAKFEMERLDLELQLLDYRAENLEIKSPVTGVVASGDLERVEGAPLTTGQTLFEIAPLERMVVEVSVRDSEIAYVQPGQDVEVRLEALPAETWRVPLANIQPRSEARDDANVFIAEAEIENLDQRLRPGMKGRAKIVAAPRRIGWILFHRPWEFLVKKLSW